MEFEQNFANWVSCLSMVRFDVGCKSMDKLYSKVAACEKKDTSSNIFESVNDLVYKYTRLKYLNVIKWPLFDGHTYSKKESKAARDFFAEYVIDMRDKENKEIWKKMVKLRK